MFTSLRFTIRKTVTNIRLILIKTLTNETKKIRKTTLPCLHFWKGVLTNKMSHTYVVSTVTFDGCHVLGGTPEVDIILKSKYSRKYLGFLAGKIVGIRVGINIHSRRKQTGFVVLPYARRQPGRTDTVRNNLNQRLAPHCSSPSWYQVR